MKKHLFIAALAALLVGCATDMTPFNKGAVLQSNTFQARSVRATNVSVKWQGGAMLPQFLGKMQDFSLHSKPVIEAALNDAGIRTPAGDGTTLEVTLAPNTQALAVGWRYPFWKNFGMSMAVVGLFRDYYSVYADYIANYKVTKGTRVVFEKTYTVDKQAELNLSEFNFGRHKVLWDRSQELFLTELTKTTLVFIQDMESARVSTR